MSLTWNEIQDQRIPMNKKWNSLPTNSHIGLIACSKIYLKMAESQQEKPLPMRIKGKTYIVMCETITPDEYNKYIKSFDKQFPIEKYPRQFLSDKYQGNYNLPRIMYFKTQYGKYIRSFQIYIQPAYHKIVDKYFHSFI